MKKIFIFIVILLVITVGLFFILKPNSEEKIELEIKSPQAMEANEVKQVSKIENYQVPILMYHYIRNADPADELGYNLSVSPQNFEKQISYLAKNNYQSLTLAEFADLKQNKLNEILAQNKKPIVLTFDDGYVDAFSEALPILQKYGFNGTFFVIRDFVNKANYLTSEQVAAMQKAGMEIGSHTLSHPDLAKSSQGISEAQIINSKLDAATFCYPAGKYNQTTVDLVKDAGYLAAVTTKSGIADHSSNLFELPRVRISEMSIENFAKKIEGK